MSRRESFADLWVVVPNWDRFQHYKDRDPPWIRVYRDLLQRDEYLNLSGAERGLLLDVWLTFAAMNGQMRVASVTRARRGRDTSGTRATHFVRLADAGFIELSASKPLPQRQRQRQSRAVTSRADVANGNGLGFQIPENLLKSVPR